MQAKRCKFVKTVADGFPLTNPLTWGNGIKLHDSGAESSLFHRPNCCDIHLILRAEFVDVPTKT